MFRCGRNRCGTYLGHAKRGPGHRKRISSLEAEILFLKLLSNENVPEIEPVKYADHPEVLEFKLDSNTVNTAGVPGNHGRT